MGTIKNVTKQTDNRFLNIYELDRENKTGKPGKYWVASRAKDIDGLKLKSGVVNPDGIIIYAICEGKVVLIRQYRYPLGGYIYEFPAGLVDDGEDMMEAGIREMKEETGLTLEPIPVDRAFSKPYFTSVGMSDEACGTIYGYASGQVTQKYQEESEEIEIVLADKDEVRRILREENVAIMCSYMLMHYLQDTEPFAFLKEKI
ncbi:MAG: NUDIX hydrolase [Hespellia sp.]|nr:NUDIX hydrolase [Hespellia sp.]